MKKEYPEMQDEKQMASEPLAVYEVHSSTPVISATDDREAKILASTVSVDEYFDELISLVHQDYADL